MDTTAEIDDPATGVFVLVHGAWGGGWAWRWVTPYLKGAGHVVYTPTLTGLGERVHLASPQVDLDTHIDDVINVLHFEDLTGVVLVGWSYGGIVVAGVADRVPERISHLVYLDSDVPRDGETSIMPSQHAKQEERARLHGDGWRVPLAVEPDDPMLAAAALERRQWIIERFTPQPLKTRLQPIRLTGAATAVPTTYIRCTVGYDPSDENTQRQDQRVRSEPSWRYLELAGNHLAPFSIPEAVADVLLEAAHVS